MVNALIGKMQEDKTITYIYCHNRADMAILGQTLLQQYQDEAAVDALLAQGHCHSPGNTTKETWRLANRQEYKAGEEQQYCNNKQEFLERAMEDVQVAYLFDKGKWRYANTMSLSPTFGAIRTAPWTRHSSQQGLKIVF